MAATTATTRIEIIDPIADPPRPDPAAVVASAVTPAGEAEALLGSLHDAVWAAARPLAPVRREASALAARGQRTLRFMQERALQRRHDGNPRRGSAVRHHVFAPIGAVERRLADAKPTSLGARGLRVEFTSDFRPLPAGGRQAEGRLSLRGSWPRLPLVIRVEPWWRDQSVVTVELRTRRRLRYPRRYFRSAHMVGRAVGELVAP